VLLWGVLIGCAGSGDVSEVMVAMDVCMQGMLAACPKIGPLTCCCCHETGNKRIFRHERKELNYIVSTEMKTLVSLFDMISKSSESIDLRCYQHQYMQLAASHKLLLPHNSSGSPHCLSSVTNSKLC